MKFKIKLFSFFILLFIYSCQSSLSEGNVSELSLIGATIEIFQNLTDKKDNSVTVRLFDQKGNTICNKGIKLKVNNIELNYRESKEMYYFTTVRYIMSDIPVGPVYSFEIILTNGKSYFLGSVKPLEESSEKNIVCDENGNFDKDFVVFWHNLKSVNELTIMKSVKLSTSTKTQQNYSYEPTVVKKIRSTGKYIIPKSTYKNSASTISSLELDFKAEHFGIMNKELLEQSKINISGHFNRAVDFDEEHHN